MWFSAEHLPMPPRQHICSIFLCPCAQHPDSIFPYLPAPTSTQAAVMWLLSMSIQTPTVRQCLSKSTPTANRDQTASWNPRYKTKSSPKRTLRPAFRVSADVCWHWERRSTVQLTEPEASASAAAGSVLREQVHCTVLMSL